MRSETNTTPGDFVPEARPFALDPSHQITAKAPGLDATILPLSKGEVAPGHYSQVADESDAHLASKITARQDAARVAEDFIQEIDKKY